MLLPTGTVRDLAVAVSDAPQTSRSHLNPFDALPFLGQTNQSLVQPLKRIAELMRVQAHQMQNGRLQIADGNFPFGDAVTQLIRFTMDHARFDSTAGQPDGETVGVMVAP